MKLTELEAVVEAIMFLTGDAQPLSAIAQAIDMDKATTRAILNSLADKYVTEGRGLRLVELEGAYQLCTAPSCFSYLRDLFQSPNRQGISQAQLETLAIIAYKQPITKGEIEDIRGVSADHAGLKLMENGLVDEVGRKDTPGRPILFGTTEAFLRHFGFRSIRELPPLDDGIEAPA